MISLTWVDPVCCQCTAVQEHVVALCVYTVPSEDFILYSRCCNTHSKLLEKVLFCLSKVDNKAADSYFSPYFNCIVLFNKNEKKNKEKVPTVNKYTLI